MLKITRQISQTTIANQLTKRPHFALMGYLLLALLSPVCVLAEDEVKVDSGVLAYQKGADLKGTLSSVGSDTLNNLMTLWAERFCKLYQGATVQVEGKGSSTAPAALISGSAQLGPMSRAMKQSEIDGFEKKYGYKPTQVRVAVDALAVFVNKDNPLTSLTLAQVDAVFSKFHRRGYAGDIANWGQLGLSGEWAQRSVSLYGRNSASGTYGFFKEEVLANGDFKDTVKEQPGSASVVQGIAVDRYGIGYSGIGYRTSGVKALNLAADADGHFIEPSQKNAYSGDYPIARFLYVYINKKPGAQLDKLTAEFIRFVLSKEGQETVVKDGYFPVPAKVVSEDLKVILGSR